MSRPKLFVGSSSEGFRIAQAVQVNLEPMCEVDLWTQGSFGLTQGTLESLVRVSDEFDFAVLVLTADDLSISRGRATPAARDNVLFELGLFIGSLGRDRTFILYNADAPPTLPSDLAGVTPATFVPHEDGNLVAALGRPCAMIQAVIERLGSRPDKGSRNRQEATPNPVGWLPCLPDCSEVDCIETVRAVVANLIPGTEAWILVRPVPGHTYWPQDYPLRDLTGSLQTEARFGRSASQDIGKEFIVLLVMASPDASARFKDFRTKHHGMPDLPPPPDVVRLAQVKVKRR